MVVLFRIAALPFPFPSPPPPLTGGEFETLAADGLKNLTGPVLGGEGGAGGGGDRLSHVRNLF
jgi:hypothetical protein